MRLRRRDGDLVAGPHLEDARIRELAEGSTGGVGTAETRHLTHCSACRARLASDDPWSALFAEQHAPMTTPPTSILALGRPAAAPRRWALPGIGALALAGAVGIVIAGARIGGSTGPSPVSPAAGVTASTNSVLLSEQRGDHQSLEAALTQLDTAARHLTGGEPDHLSIAASLRAARTVLLGLPSAEAETALRDVDAALELEDGVPTTSTCTANTPAACGAATPPASPDPPSAAPSAQDPQTPLPTDAGSVPDGAPQPTPAPPDEPSASTPPSASPEPTTTPGPASPSA